MLRHGRFGGACFGRVVFAVGNVKVDWSGSFLDKSLRSADGVVEIFAPLEVPTSGVAHCPDLAVDDGIEVHGGVDTLTIGGV